MLSCNCEDTVNSSMEKKIICFIRSIKSFNFSIGIPFGKNLKMIQFTKCREHEFNSKNKQKKL